MPKQTFEDEYGPLEMIQLHEDPQSKRPSEVNAVRQMIAPPLPPARDAEQHYYDMQNEGKELCQRCQLFKYRDEFGKDERNTERGGTQTWCLQCDSERKQIKRQVIRNGQRSEGYRYVAREKKSKTKRR